jgi:dienelactone hydrolase
MKTLFTAIICLAFSTHDFAQGTDISYSEGNTELKGYFVKAKNTQGKAPGVVVIPDWMGLGEHAKHSADNLSALGYNALVADIYGENVRPKNSEEAGKTAGYYKTNREVYRARIRAAIDQLVKQGSDPDKIAVMGYCFGGTGALEAARAGLSVKGAISFHGGLDKAANLPDNKITTKVLVLHGADDPFEPEAQIKAFHQEMRDSKADWQMIYYPNAVHAFTNPQAGNDNSKGAAYNELADKRSWEHMKLFLKEVFGV